MKILLDMNMSPLWVEFLQTAGIETDPWSSLGDAAEADENIIKFAASQGLTVLTLDTVVSATLKSLRPNTLAFSVASTFHSCELSSLDMGTSES